MKRGLFLVATFTLSSALYAQGTLTRQQAREVFAAYNPALLEKAAQNEDLNQFVEDVLTQYVAQNPPDTVESRYTLAALARNFENSIAVNAALAQYKNALIYSQQGGAVQEAARVHASKALSEVFPRIWAVSVQVKEDLLAQYQKDLKAPGITPAQKQGLQAAIKAVKADLKNLRTRTGEQLLALTQDALAQAEEQAAQAQEANSFDVKTSSHHPRAG